MGAGAPVEQVPVKDRVPWEPEPPQNRFLLKTGCHGGQGHEEQVPVKNRVPRELEPL